MHILENTIGPFPLDANDCLEWFSSDNQLFMEFYAYENTMFRFNWHASLEIMMVLQGHLKTVTEHGVFDLDEDGILVINPNTGHASMRKEEGTITAVLHISKSYLEQLMGNVNLPTIVCSCANLQASKPIHTFLRNMVATLYWSKLNRLDSRNLVANGVLDLVCASLIEQCSNHILLAKGPKISRKQENVLKNVTKMLDKRFKEKISLKEAAAVGNLNPSYLSSFFKSSMGIGFYDYLTKKRTAYAAYLLNTTNQPLPYVAEESGFSDAKSLHIAFKKFFGMSPGEYRSSLDEPSSSYNLATVPHRLDFEDPLLRQKMVLYQNNSLSILDMLS